MRIIDEIKRLRQLETNINGCPDTCARDRAQCEMSRINRHLANLGLEPKLPHLEERAFYVERGIDGVDKMLDIMKSSHADELVPEYMNYYGINGISLTESRLRIIASEIAKKEDDALPYIAARLRFLLDAEKWGYLTDPQAHEKWDLINAFVGNDVDPYSDPVRDTLARKYSNAVRHYLSAIENGDGCDKNEAIRRLGDMGITETDPKVLQYCLDPTNTEPPLASHERYLIATNPDWDKIAGSFYWYNQADGTPERTKFGLRLEHTMVMAQNPDWKEIALSRTLERYSKLDT